jgi:hypothetical protein
VHRQRSECVRHPLSPLSGADRSLRRSPRLAPFHTACAFPHGLRRSPRLAPWATLCRPSGFPLLQSESVRPQFSPRNVETPGVEVGLDAARVGACATADPRSNRHADRRSGSRRRRWLPSGSPG